MDTHQSLKEVLGHLEARNLSAAINGLENFLSVHPNQIICMPYVQTIS